VTALFDNAVRLLKRFSSPWVAEQRMGYVHSGLTRMFLDYSLRVFVVPEYDELRMSEMVAFSPLQEFLHNAVKRIGGFRWGVVQILTSAPGRQDSISAAAFSAGLIDLLVAYSSGDCVRSGGFYSEMRIAGVTVFLASYGAERAESAPR
jgi:hypothetical protein